MFRFFQNKEKNILYLKAVLLFVIPFLFCVIYLLISGKGLYDVSLIDSSWNDELIYFKQTEAIVKYGVPAGYFGYDENHSMYLSLAAWSPVLSFPWIIWGKLFGWTMVSPFLCNMFLYGTAMALFVLLINPKWKQVIQIIIVFGFWGLNIRYIFSCMPEVIVISHLLVFFGLLINEKANHAKWKIILLFVLGSYLTLMRPYYVLLIISVAIFYINGKFDSLRKSLIVSAGWIISTLGVYVLIVRLFTSEYLMPIYDTKWIDLFFEKGFGAGAQNLFRIMFNNTYDVYYRMRHSISGNLPEGTYYLIFLIVLALFLIKIIFDCFVWKQKENLEVEVIYASIQLVVFFAIIVMYDLTDGSKHLITFIAVGSILLATFKGLDLIRSGVIVITCILLIWTKWKANPINYQIPFESNETYEAKNWLYESFNKNMIIDSSNNKNENTIIWVLVDKDLDNEKVIRTQWQYLYCIPGGMGINCCSYEYMQNNFDSIQSKYIMVAANGLVESMCESDSRWVEISRVNGCVVYRQE